jgi:hypothetical protein
VQQTSPQQQHRSVTMDRPGGVVNYLNVIVVVVVVIVLVRPRESKQAEPWVTLSATRLSLQWGCQTTRDLGLTIIRIRCSYINRKIGLHLLITQRTVLQIFSFRPASTCQLSLTYYVVQGSKQKRSIRRSEAKRWLAGSDLSQSTESQSHRLRHTQPESARLCAISHLR